MDSVLDLRAGSWEKGWMLRRWIMGGMAVLAAGKGFAVPVEIRAGWASSAPARGFPLEAALDGQVQAGQGWQLEPGAMATDQAAVFLPQDPVSARQLLLQLFFPGPGSDSYFGKFGVDVTTDNPPSPDGRWMPLILEASGGDDPSVMLPAAPTVLLENRVVPFALTLRARVPFDGITGFRLRVFGNPGPERPANSGVAAAVAEVGRPDPENEKLSGGFLLGEFLVETETPRSSNLALGRQVYASRQVAAGLPSRHLTDGFHATWSQPETSPDLPDAFFQLDLGQTTDLDHVVVRWRQGPERPLLPDGYSVELLTESGGFDGGLAWSARRTSGQSWAPSDVIRGLDGEGEFAGRSLMIHVKGGAGDQPQIAEIEVYPALRTQAVQWMADGRVLPEGGVVSVPAGTRDLSMVLAASAFGAAVHEGRWKLDGWTPDWREAAMGSRVTVGPVPGPGTYQLRVQGRHTDGLWDMSGVPVAVQVAAPWWHHIPTLSGVVAGGFLTVSAGGWLWVARRMRRRLNRTEQHLELHRDRLRISRDMHDEIGARLTSIAMLAERTQRQAEPVPELLNELANQARTTVEALDTIVWAVNPRHDTVGGLADYLSDYVPAYLAAAGVDCFLDLGVSQPACPLPLAVRHNLLMAVKEALQNVVKHSGARQVEVRLRDSGERLVLTVSDDGCGFPEAPPAGISHTGMDSMRQRLGESGGSCVFTSNSSGAGVQVCLSVPLIPC